MGNESILSLTPDISAMDEEQLLHHRTQIMEQIAALDRREPKNMNSDAYEEWADEHEELEDLLDEIDDRLDDLRA